MKKFLRFVLVIVMLSVSIQFGYTQNAEKNGTSLDRSGLIGAVPTENDLQWKTTIACEDQKLFIECPNIYNRIQIHSCFFGREDAVVCKHPQHPSEKNCAEQNVTVKAVVLDLCQGEAKCEVTASNDFLAQYGTVICPDVYKYLQVDYRCVPRTALNDVPGLTTYNQVTTITNVITTHYAPSTIVTGVHNRVGETMVSHQGIQTVEERIVPQTIEVQKTYSVPKIQLQNRIVELQSHVGGSKPAKIVFAPLLLPGATKSQLKGTTGNENEVTYHVNMTGSPEIRSNIRKENTKSKVGKSRSLLRSKNILKKTLLAKQNSFIKDRYGNFTRSEYDLLS
ncbi:uncharacterized protein LOC124438694 [Xenia sp. Carnegie-2017]|uniref:uncharacterized protein LOC124438694 n=1 Tax=Xenia sp. Carnegie-2017 TaxID=2897299 RepID=UPI001F04AF90|nr:uncharacterized protein LOC124438694 [Xenia sp. Carnegie-2017]